MVWVWPLPRVKTKINFANYCCRENCTPRHKIPPYGTNARVHPIPHSSRAARIITASGYDEKTNHVFADLLLQTILLVCRCSRHVSTQCCVSLILTLLPFFILRFSLNLVLTADGDECNGSHPTVRVSTRLESVLPVRKYTQWILVSGKSV